MRLMKKYRDGSFQAPQGLCGGSTLRQFRARTIFGAGQSVLRAPLFWGPMTGPTFL